jgi:hypothetical protein
MLGRLIFQTLLVMYEIDRATAASFNAQAPVIFD